MSERIIRNRCMCPDCEDIIESTHRWDFVKCKCGKIFTDGGTDYIRRSFGAIPLDEIKDDYELPEKEKRSQRKI